MNHFPEVLVGSQQRGLRFVRGRENGLVADALTQFSGLNDRMTVGTKPLYDAEINTFIGDERHRQAPTGCKTSERIASAANLKAACSASVVSRG